MTKTFVSLQLHREFENAWGVLRRNQLYFAMIIEAKLIELVWGYRILTFGFLTKKTTPPLNDICTVHNWSTMIEKKKRLMKNADYKRHIYS